MTNEEAIAASVSGAQATEPSDDPWASHYPAATLKAARRLIDLLCGDERHLPHIANALDTFAAQAVAAHTEAVAALRGLMPFMEDDEMVGESEFEQAVLRARAALMKLEA